jgi:hypothetical protein
LCEIVRDLEIRLQTGHFLQAFGTIRNLTFPGRFGAFHRKKRKRARFPEPRSSGEWNMKHTAKLMPAVLMAAVFALPALVQHAYAQPETTDVQDAVNSGLTPTEWQQRMSQGMTSRLLEGRRVMRANGQSLGFILGVNDIAREVQVETPANRSITLPESELRVQGDTVYANSTAAVAMK